MEPAYSREVGLPDRYIAMEGYDLLNSEESEPVPAAERRGGQDLFAVVGIGSVVIAVLIGVWARTAGLEISALAIDEYFFVESVRRIIDTGLPAFETGGYYIRGLLIQYLTVPSVLLTGSDELGVRLPSVVFGLATVLVAYFYGRRIFGRQWALVLVVLLLLSSWQVEFSRFGRMYSGFQLVTLAMLLTLYDVMGKARGLRLYLPPLLCFVALLTHELAISLLPLLFLPYVAPGVADRFGTRRRQLVYAAALLPAMFAALIQNMLNFRLLGVTDRLPADYAHMGDGLILYPSFPFWHFGAAPAQNLVVGLAWLALVAGGAWFLYRRGRIGTSTAVAVVCLAAAVAHFLVIAVLVGLVLASRYGIPLSIRQHPMATKLTLGAAAASAAWVGVAGWITYGVGSREWIASTGSTVFRQAARRTFVWPDPGPSVIDAWLAELPILAIVLAVALLIQLGLRGRDSLPDVFRNPAFIIAYFVLFLGLFDPQFSVTRYTFFIYPIALTVLVQSVRDVSRMISRRMGGKRAGMVLGVPTVFLLFGFGGDFHPRHLIRAGSIEFIYRMGELHGHEVTWYERDDYASPARFVEHAAEPSEPVIVSQVWPVSHYLHREHSVYIDRRSGNFSSISREGGEVELWSGERLLGTHDDIRMYTRCRPRVWIVQSTHHQYWFRPEEVWHEQLKAVERLNVSPDGGLEVLLVSLADPDCHGAIDE